MSGINHIFMVIIRKIKKSLGCNTTQHFFKIRITRIRIILAQKYYAQGYNIIDFPFNQNFSA